MSLLIATIDPFVLLLIGWSLGFVSAFLLAYLVGRHSWRR